MQSPAEDARLGPALSARPWPWLALLALLALNGLWAFPLHEPDEGRYAGIAAAMLRDGDWLSTRLNGIDYFEKPPLHFWLVASCFTLLGRSELAARLPSALSYLAMALLLAAWAGRAFGRAHARSAALVFATLPLVAFFSHLLIVDLSLALWTTCCLYAGYRGLVEPDPEGPPRRGWVLLCWVAAALATLTKGPIGLVLPMAGLGGYLVFSRAWRRVAALLRPDGPLLYLLVCAPWFVWMSRQHPGYAWAFFVEENLGRATTGGGFDRKAPLWFYVPILLGTFAPWALLLPRMAQEVRAPETDAAQRLRRLLACAVLVPFAILSVVGSKLSYYLLPLAPPFALLAASALHGLRPPPDALQRWGGRTLVGVGALLILVALACIPALVVDTETVRGIFGKGEVVEAYVREERLRFAAGIAALPALLLTAVLGGAAAIAAGRALGRGAPRACCARLGGVALSVALGLPWILTGLGPAISSQRIARLVSEHAGATGPVVCYGTFLRGVPYYLDRPVHLWTATRAEFGHLLPRGANPYALQEDVASLQRLTRTKGAVFIVKNDFAEEVLRQLSPVPLRRVGVVGERVLLVPAPEEERK
ncbi:MAG: ArnT family glycosyltransferase [Planctomycetota bacterium]